MSEASAKTIVQFGAGNIGRSLVGQLFSRAGYEVIFVDAVPAIVDALNAKGRYVVKVKDALPPNAPAEIWVERVRGLHAADVEAIARSVAAADLVSTAVGAAVLPKVFPALAQGLQQRTEPLSIILCENLRGAGAITRQGLAEHLPADFDLDRRLGTVETSIGKMVPIMPAEVRERDPLEVWAEAYNQIVADRAGFIGTPPEVEGLVLKDHFGAYVDRKLFIHNLGHATAGYHGFLKGKTYVWECMANERIRAEAEGAMWEAGRALIQRYPQEFNENNQREHIDDLLRRFANQALGDTVFRVGRDLHRKLAPQDRCIGALRLVSAQGAPADHIIRAIAAALCFRATDESGASFPQDTAFHETLAAHGPAWVLREISGLDAEKDRALMDAVLHAYDEIKKR